MVILEQCKLEEHYQSIIAAINTWEKDKQSASQEHAEEEEEDEKSDEEEEEEIQSDQEGEEFNLDHLSENLEHR